MRDLDELRADGEAFLADLRHGNPYDAEEIEFWIADMLDCVGMGSNRIADTIDFVVLLAFWARIMQRANPDIAVSGWRNAQGVHLSASLPAGSQVNLEALGLTKPGGPTTITLQEGHRVGQLIFNDDQRPQAWLRTLFDNRAWELQAKAYYDWAGEPMPAGGMPDGTTVRRPREVKS